jgi:hypothetical protein
MKANSRGVLAAGVGTILSAIVAGTASAAVSGVEVGAGTLEAKGLRATVPVTFSCGEGERYEVYLNVSQVTQQKNVTGAESWTGGECTGETQTVTFQVRPAPKAFKKGSALAETNVTSWCFVGTDPEYGDDIWDYCGSQGATEVIKLR